MSTKTLLTRLMPVTRTLHDLALEFTSKLYAYDDVTLYRYSNKRTEYGDEQKTLIETVYNVRIWLDFPGDVTNLSHVKEALASRASVVFIEDYLPIIAMFPWKHNEEILKVNEYDEFEFSLIDEFDSLQRIRFQITERRSNFTEHHIFREWIVVPQRIDIIDLSYYETASTTGETGSFENTEGNIVKTITFDPNYDPGRVGTNLYSEYD